VTGEHVAGAARETEGLTLHQGDGPIGARERGGRRDGAGVTLGIGQAPILAIIALAIVASTIWVDSSTKPAIADGAARTYRAYVGLLLLFAPATRRLYWRPGWAGAEHHSTDERCSLAELEDPHGPSRRSDRS
jgi:hypothetical protein